jgi:hypothetical protein
LEYIDFSDNLIDDKGIELVGRVFEHCIDLKRINLANNKISGQNNNLQVFLMKAGHLLTKVRLDLSNNLLEDFSIPVIEGRVFFEESN